MRNTDFTECFIDNDIDATCENWTNMFMNVAKKYIPNKTVTIRPNDSPWYTNELRLLKRRMLHSFHKHKQSKSENDWLKYTDLRTKYHKSLDEAEANYKQSLGVSLGTQRNTKKWWQTVKWLIGKGGDTSYPSLVVNNNQITNNRDKAEAFNHFFLSHSDIDDSNAQLPDEQNFQVGLDNILATEQEVNDLLKCIDPSKATGPDGISPRLLKEAGEGIVPSLTKLINFSLSTSKVPHSWKLANVIPLFKKGEKSDVNNYRPVSLLSCVSKILERIVFKHLFNYLREINFISIHQSGFQSGDSTVNQLSYLYHFFCDALDKKKNVHIVFCDIKKAFDRVYHKGLIYKLKKAGIHGVLLNWFQNYLADRYQQVIIRGQKSEIGVIKAGVPQGSVLGPLLFLIYINDLTNVVHNCKVKLFADDTSVFIDFTNIDEAADALNDDLNNIQNWADQWLVNFSPAKTKLMTCSFKKKQVTDIKFNNIELSSVESHKHLGLTLSSDLSWTNHITDMLKSVSVLVDVLKKLKYDIDRKSLELTYFTFIRPKLEYACHIWDNCSKCDSDKLESLQLDMARLVTGARKGTSHELLYQETKWQLLSERRQCIKFKNLLKIVNNQTPLYLQTLLPANIGTIRPNSRNADNYYVVKTRTETFRSSFIPSSIKMWNSSNPNERSIDYVMELMKVKNNDIFYIGNRAENIKHAQLRMNCSKLNAHLFSLHVVDTSACLCGNPVEDNYHFFLDCPLYYMLRINLFQQLQSLEINDIDISLLLYGSDNYDFKTNCSIVEAVHCFIKESERL